MRRGEKIGLKGHGFSRALEFLHFGVEENVRSYILLSAVGAEEGSPVRKRWVNDLEDTEHRRCDRVLRMIRAFHLDVHVHVCFQIRPHKMPISRASKGSSNAPQKLCRTYGAPDVPCAYPALTHWATLCRAPGAGSTATQHTWGEPYFRRPQNVETRRHNFSCAAKRNEKAGF